MLKMPDRERRIAEAARAVAEAEHLLFTAGAGMGVDSGLPDFRGNEGFWKAYPPYRALKIGFTRMANPAGFDSDPPFAWGFYGHRLNLYRRTVPHQGFAILLRWATQKKSAFVVTSNVDGQFQHAGFDEAQVNEIHGSIHHLQCTKPCSDRLWPADGTEVTVDRSTMRAATPLPSCPHCGGLARPNILMFNDFGFVLDRTRDQELRYRAWLDSLGNAPLTVVEMGAGVALPSIRTRGENLHYGRGARLIRINPRKPLSPPKQVGLALGALEALQAIDAQLQQQPESQI